MGIGGPLAFLNKKPWHPLNRTNQEEIWKREQEYLAEAEKRDERLKQVEAEREKEEFEGFVADAVQQKCGAHRRVRGHPRPRPVRAACSGMGPLTRGARTLPAPLRCALTLRLLLLLILS